MSSKTERTNAYGSFVGRARELAELGHALDGAYTGSGGLALLTGEPGIGKTRTAEEFSARARRRGASVLWGHCHEGEECPPYGPLIAALRSYARSTEARTLRELAGEGAADIITLLPELRGVLGEPPAQAPLVSDDGEQRLFSSLFLFLRAAALRSPLALILDNLHLADPSSLRFLGHIAHDLADNRVLILGTCRNPVETRRDALAVTIEVAAKTRGFRWIRLGGLSKEEVRQFLACVLAAQPAVQLVDAIHERTDGNPLFLIELARHMATAPGIGTSQRLPDGIRQAINHRLECLSLPCTRILSTAAVLGRTFSWEVLCAITNGMSREEVSRGLQEALGSSAVREDDPAAGTYRFVHALVQETLVERTPADELARLHLSAARVMGQLCDSDPKGRALEILGHLVAGARDADPDELARWTRLAADHAMTRYAPDQALILLDRTLDVLSRTARSSPARVAALFHLRGQALTDLQRPEEATESLVRAFDCFLEAGDSAGAIEVALFPAMSWISTAGAGMWLGGLLPVGISELRERALALSGRDSPARAWLLVGRGSRADLDEALCFARRSHSEHLEAAAAAGLAYHGLLAWEFTACAQWLAEASGLAARINDLQIWWSIHYTRYYYCMFTGDPRGTTEAVDALFGIARGTGWRRRLIVAHRCASQLAAYRGRWSAAREHAASALELMEGAGPVFNHVMVVQILLYVELQTGHLKAAGRYLGKLERWNDVPSPGDIRRNILGARVTGDTRLLAMAPEHVDLPSTDARLSLFVNGELSRAARLAAIHRDTRAAEACRELLHAWRGTFDGISTDALVGSLDSVRGRVDEAIDGFENGLTLCRRAGYLPEVAWICLDYAQSIAARDSAGDRERAEGLLREGLELCRTLGMQPLKEQTLCALHRLEGRAGEQPAYPDGLTGREVDVLRLIAAGFTNAQIAERLFVSPLTVAKHVHNLLDKTGMSNRAEAVAYASRRGIIGD